MIDKKVIATYVVKTHKHFGIVYETESGYYLFVNNILDQISSNLFNELVHNNFQTPKP